MHTNTAPSPTWSLNESLGGIGSLIDEVQLKDSLPGNLHTLLRLRDRLD